MEHQQPIHCNSEFQHNMKEILRIMKEISTYILSNGMVQLPPKTCSPTEWELKSCYLSGFGSSSKKQEHTSLPHLQLKNATYEASQATCPILITKAETSEASCSIQEKNRNILCFQSYLAFLPLML